MIRPAESITVRGLLGCGVLLAAALATNCNEQKSGEVVKTQPAERPSASAPAPQTPSETRPAAQPTVPPATQPQTRPATQPEEVKPESTYDSNPPYTVNLYVTSPEEKQPGWLRIDELTDEKALAKAQGRFPEQNRIYVDTGNVRRITIHVGFLPLRPKERVILQIDGHGMVLSRSRPYTTLELSPTGEWAVVKDKRD